ncbi:MAG: hypothetical protein ACLPKB_17200 [Xanthobacteraceae bacterium]
MAQVSIVTSEARFLVRLPALINLPPSFRQNALSLTPAICRDRVLWAAVGALAAASIAFVSLNYGASRQAALKADFTETVVYRGSEEQPSFADRWEQAERDAYQSDEAFWNNPPEESEANRLASADNQDITDAIAAESGAKASAARLSSVATQSGGSDTSVSSREQRDVVHLDEVEQYLWEVYQRVPTKRDSSGDFTWKDQAAAKRVGMPMPVYVIRGMDRDFREQLYHAGRAMDAAGIKWSMLSAFRDDYRQHLASGFKASGGNSLHGGSARTGGYGHGRAVDVTSVGDDGEPVWRWLDAHGAKYGLYRPMPGADPAHVQSRGDWRELAGTLRQARIKTAQANASADAASAKPKLVASASQ